MLKNRGKLSQLVVGLLLVIAGSWLIIFSLSRSDTNQPTITIDHQTINVDVADEPQEITVGLGGRDSLEQDRGMLFIMPQPIVASFWMKDMKFPIDFVWIDEGKHILAITPSIGVDSYPITFSPPSAVKYVLEVNAGLSAHLGWLPGDEVELAL